MLKNQTLRLAPQLLSPASGAIQPACNPYLGQTALQIRCQNVEAPSSSPAGSTDSTPLPQPMSPDTIKVEQPEGDGSSQGDDQDAQPMQTCQLLSSASPLPPLPPPPPGPGKLIRRFSEQVRFSVWRRGVGFFYSRAGGEGGGCLLYTSDAADES